MKIGTSKFWGYVSAIFVHLISLEVSVFWV